MISTQVFVSFQDRNKKKYSEEEFAAIQMKAPSEMEVEELEYWAEQILNGARESRARIEDFLEMVEQFSEQNRKMFFLHKKTPFEKTFARVVCSPVDSIRYPPEAKGEPEEIGPVVASRLLMNRQKILFLTGDEIGSQSYKKYLSELTEQQEHEMMSKAFFDSDPLAAWKFALCQRDAHFKSLPSQEQLDIQAILEALFPTGISAFVATTCVDGHQSALMRASKDLGILTKKAHEEDAPLFTTKYILENHGNCRYCMCSHDCCALVHEIPADLESLQSIEDVPPCEQCQEAYLRPLTLWSDEGYNQRFYQGEVTYGWASKADAVIIVGNQLETTLSRQIVEDAMKRGALTIEMNGTEPVLLRGKVRHVYACAEESLRKLATSLQKLCKGKKSLRYETVSKYT